MMLQRRDHHRRAFPDAGRGVHAAPRADLRRRTGHPSGGRGVRPKVSAFLRYIGQENFLDLDALTVDALKAMIDRMVSSPISPEEQAAAVQKLRQIEQVNVDTARRLLEK